RSLPAELVRAHRERLADVAAREHLDVLRLADEAVLVQELRRDLGAGVEAIRDRVEIDDRVLDAKQVVKAALRHAAVERHLAAFETALVLEARSRLCALVPAAGRLAVAGALAAPDPLLCVRRALGR